MAADINENQKKNPKNPNHFSILYIVLYIQAQLQILPEE